MSTLLATSPPILAFASEAKFLSTPMLGVLVATKVTTKVSLCSQALLLAPPLAVAVAVAVAVVQPLGLLGSRSFPQPASVTCTDV